MPHNSVNKSGECSVSSAASSHHHHHHHSSRMGQNHHSSGSFSHSLPSFNHAVGMSTAALFHHHVAKIRRNLGGTARARHNWKIGIVCVRFLIRLHRSAVHGVRLTQMEMNALQRLYWEYSQQPGGLYHVDGISRMLQHFNQPQPPTTVEELLEYVKYDSQGGTVPISFGKVFQMMLKLKREYVAGLYADDDEELFAQLSSTAAAVSHDDDDEHESRRHGGSGTTVDAAAVAAVLKQFDLRVTPPQAYVPSQSLRKNTHSKGGGSSSQLQHHPNNEDEAPQLLSLAEFKAFLMQNPPRPQPLSNLTAQFSLAPTDSFTPSAMVALEQQLTERSRGSGVSSPLLRSSGTTKGDGAAAVIHHGDGGVQYIRRSGGAAATTTTTATSHSSPTNHAQSSGTDAAYLDTLDSTEAMLAEGYSHDFVEMKQRVTRLVRYPSPTAETNSTVDFKELGREIERLEMEGPWKLHQGASPTGPGRTAQRQTSASSRQSVMQLTRTSKRSGSAAAPDAWRPPPSLVSSSMDKAQTTPLRKRAQLTAAAAASLAAPVSADAVPMRRSGTPQDTQERLHGSAHRTQRPASAAPRVHNNHTVSDAAASRPRSALAIVHSMQTLPNPISRDHASSNGGAVDHHRYESHVPIILVDSRSRDEHETSPQQRHGGDGIVPRPTSASSSAYAKYGGGFSIPPANRPASAMAIRKKLDLYVKPTPLEDLCMKPPFALNENQQENLALWYQRQYQNLNPDYNASETYSFEPETRALASRVREALAVSKARSINDERAHDYHRISPADAYAEVRAEELRTRHSYQQAPPRMMTMNRQGIQPIHIDEGRLGPQWLQGSSFVVAQKQRPPLRPPSGFVSGV